MLSIDFSRQRTQFGLELLVLLDIFSAGHGNLNQHYFISEFGVIVEESIKAFQFLCQAFDMIEPVHSDNNLDPIVSLFERTDPLLYVGLLQCICELLRVDPDDEPVDTNQPVLILNLIGDLGTRSTNIDRVRANSLRKTNGTYRRLAHVSLKFCLYSSVWNPIKSLDSMPSIRCLRTGRFLQKSPAGNGVCNENPIAQDLPCCSSRLRSSSGSNMRW